MINTVSYFFCSKNYVKNALLMSHLGEEVNKTMLHYFELFHIHSTSIVTLQYNFTIFIYRKRFPRSRYSCLFIFHSLYNIKKHKLMRNYFFNTFSRFMVDFFILYFCFLYPLSLTVCYMNKRS